jgi:hypothetical protein
MTVTSGRDRDRRRDGDGMGVHLKRLYARIDDLDVRLRKIERIVWVLGSAAVVTAGTAVVNLVTNMSQGGIGQ